MEDEVKEYEIKRRIKSCNNHFWVESESQDENSELLSVNCLHCPTGANLNPETHQVKDGAICSR